MYVCVCTCFIYIYIYIYIYPIPYLTPSYLTSIDTETSCSKQVDSPGTSEPSTVGKEGSVLTKNVHSVRSSSAKPGVRRLEYPGQESTKVEASGTAGAPQESIRKRSHKKKPVKQSYPSFILL